MDSHDYWIGLSFEGVFHDDFRKTQLLSANFHIKIDSACSNYSDFFLKELPIPLPCTLLLYQFEKGKITTNKLLDEHIALEIPGPAS